jgi:archaellum component FlaC
MWKTLSWTAAGLALGAAFLSSKTKQAISDEAESISIATDNARMVQGELKKAEEQLTAGKAARKKAEDDTLDIEKQTAALKDKVDDIAKELGEKKSLLEEVNGRYEKAKTAVDNVGGIQQLKDQLTALQREKSTLESQVSTSKAKVASAIETKIRMDKEIDTLRAKEAWQAQGIIEDSFRGRVTSVDPTWGYAVINAGSSRGVVSGATLDVRRGRSTVGQAKVTNVEIGRSIIEPVTGSFADLEGFRAGDTVAVSTTSSATAWRSKQAPAPAAPSSSTPATPPAEAPSAPAEAAPAAPAEAAPTEAAPAAPSDPFTTPSAPTEPAAPAESAPAAPAEAAPATPMESAPAEPAPSSEPAPTPPAEEKPAEAPAQ